MSRCTTLNGLLRDPTQLSTEAIANCTLALIETITTGSEYAGLEGVADTASETLSGVLKLDLGRPRGRPHCQRVQCSAEPHLCRAGQPMWWARNRKNSIRTLHASAAASIDLNSLILEAVFRGLSLRHEVFNEKSIASLGGPGRPPASALGVSVLQYKNNPSGS